RTPVYDARAIAAQIAEFEAYGAVWEAWFDAAGISPLRLDYDALSAAPVATLTGILDALQLEPARAASVRPRTKKLADDVTTEWISRFQAEHG
ncbi:MAG: Stf0 family sulfotransferase, partial [Pseudomonadota bacterium]